MARGLSSSMRSAVAARVKRPIVFFEGEFASGIVRMCSEPANVMALSTVHTFANGYQGASAWSVLADGATYLASLGGDASVILSLADLVGGFTGTLKVRAGGDNDYIGFAFCYGDAQHFYLFDWYCGSGEGQPGIPGGNGVSSNIGMRVVKVSGAADCQTLWNATGSPGVVDVLWSNDVPWVVGVKYGFDLVMNDAGFAITVSQGNTVLAQVQINDLTYRTGKVGFYNYSQDGVEYFAFWPRTWSGRNWIGGGDLVGISPVVDSTGLKAEGVTVSLAGIKNSLISQALTECQHGFPGALWLGLLDDDDQLIADPASLFAGMLDSVQIKKGRKTSTIALQYEHRMLDHRPSGFTYTQEVQKLFYPDDTGFRFVNDLQCKDMSAVYFAYGAGK